MNISATLEAVTTVGGVTLITLDTGKVTGTVESHVPPELLAHMVGREVIATFTGGQFLEVREEVTT